MIRLWHPRSSTILKLTQLGGLALVREDGVQREQGTEQPVKPVPPELVLKPAGPGEGGEVALRRVHFPKVVKKEALVGAQQLVDVALEDR